MKLSLLIALQTILSISCFSQNEPWFFYDHPDFSNDGIFAYKTNNLLVFDIPRFGLHEQFQPAFREIDKEGNLINEVEIPFTYAGSKVFINKLDSNFLLTYVDFDFMSLHEIRFISKLFDYNLNLLQDTSIKMTNHWCVPNPGFICDVGSYQTILPLKMDSIQLIGNLGRKIDSSQMFKVTYNQKGFINELKLDPVHISANYLYSKNIMAFQQTPETYYLNNGGNFELRNRNLKILNSKDYTGFSQNQILPWGIAEFHRLEDSTYIIFAGTSYQEDTGISRKIILGKFDKKLNFLSQDTVEIPTFFHGSHTSNFGYVAFNKGIIEEPDGNFISFLSYKNQESADTSSSRILVLRYDKDLNILCNKTYIARDKEITIRDVTTDVNGNYFLSVGYATKENSFGEISTTIIKITKNCDIPGMETIQEYFGELSTSKINETYRIRLWQNPIDNKLVIHAERSFPSGDPTIDIYDFSGKLIIESKAHINGTMASISAEQLMSGLYIYQMKVDGKLIGVGKFAKK
jgi:hypothetical protein